MNLLKLLIVTIVTITYSATPSFAFSFRDETIVYNDITHNGVKRTYGIYVPLAIAKGSTRVPLVIMLHGGGGNADNASKMTGFSPKADKEGFIVAYPNGSNPTGSMLTFNAYHCCGYALRNKIDDVGFISDMIDEIVKKYPVDPKRVYVTGMSNGGLLAHRLGIELSNKIAAIAPVVAGLQGDETLPFTFVPAMFINGANDEHIPKDGGKPDGLFSALSWDGTALKPVLYQGEFWSEANHCSKKPVEGKMNEQVLTYTYNCPKGHDVVNYVVLDQGHAWPGGQKGTIMGDEPSKSLNATDVIWDFFKKFSK